MELRSNRINIFFILLFLYSCQTQPFTSEEKSLIRVSYQPYENIVAFRLDTLQHFESIEDLLITECNNQKDEFMVWVGFIFNLNDFSMIPSKDPEDNIVVPCATKICKQFGTLDHFYDELFISEISDDSLLTTSRSIKRRLSYTSYLNYLDSLLNTQLNKKDLLNIEYGINIILNDQTSKENINRILVNSLKTYNTVAINWTKSKSHKIFTDSSKIDVDNLYFNPLYINLMVQKPNKNYYFLQFN